MAVREVSSEKVGTGPYIASEIMRVYNTYRMPMRVTALTTRGQYEVEVMYDYTKASGEQCSSSAVVSLSEEIGVVKVNSILPRGDS